MRFQSAPRGAFLACAALLLALSGAVQAAPVGPCSAAKTCGVCVRSSSDGTDAGTVCKWCPLTSLTESTAVYTTARREQLKTDGHEGVCFAIGDATPQARNGTEYDGTGSCTINQFEHPYSVNGWIVPAEGSGRSIVHRPLAVERTALGFCALYSPKSEVPRKKIEPGCTQYFDCDSCLAGEPTWLNPFSGRTCKFCPKVTLSRYWPSDHEVRNKQSFGACVDASDSDQLSQDTDMTKNVVGGCVVTRFEHPAHKRGWLGGDKVYSKEEAKGYCDRFKPPQDVISAAASVTGVTDRKAEEVGELAEQLNVLQSLADDITRLNYLRTVDNTFFYNDFVSKWRTHAGAVVNAFGDMILNAVGVPSELVDAWKYTESGLAGMESLMREAEELPRKGGKADIHTFTDLTFNDLEHAYAGVIAEALERFRAPEAVLSAREIMARQFEDHVNDTVYDFSDKFHAWITDVSVNIANGVGQAYKINTHPATTVTKTIIHGAVAAATLGASLAVSGPIIIADTSATFAAGASYREHVITKNVNVLRLLYILEARQRGHIDHLLLSHVDQAALDAFWVSGSDQRALKDRMKAEPLNMEHRVAAARMVAASSLHATIKAKYAKRAKLSPVVLSLIDDPMMPPLKRVCDIRREPNHGCLPHEFCKREFAFFPTYDQQFARNLLSPYGVCAPRFKSPRMKNGLPCLTHSDCQSAYCSFKKVHARGRNVFVSAGLGQIRPFMELEYYPFISRFVDELPFERRFAAMVGVCKKAVPTTEDEIRYRFDGIDRRVPCETISEYHGFKECLSHSEPDEVYPDMAAPIYPPGSLTAEEMDAAIKAERQRQLDVARAEVRRLVVEQMTAAGQSTSDAAVDAEVARRMEVVQTRTTSLQRTTRIGPTTVAPVPTASQDRASGSGLSLGIGPATVDAPPAGPAPVLPTPDQASRIRENIEAARRVSVQIGSSSSGGSSSRGASGSSSGSASCTECTVTGIMRGSFLEAHAVHRPVDEPRVEEQHLRAFPRHENSFSMRSQRYRAGSLFELMSSQISENGQSA